MLIRNAREVKMEEKTKESLMFILSVFVFASVSAMAGFGLFWMKMLKGVNTFSSIYFGMFVSAIVMVLFCHIWLFPFIDIKNGNNKQVNRNRSKKKRR